MPNSNNKISILQDQQIPFFIREDHTHFVDFLKAYYRYLEEYDSTLKDGRLIERLNSHMENQYIDTVRHSELELELQKKFLQAFSRSTVIDKAILLKYAQDLYRARGTAIATRFLVQAITGEEKTEVYHPKVDILKASDGKWFKQKSLRVRNIMVDGQSNTALSGLQKFVGRTLTGNNSNASATVESVNRFYETGILISEILLSEIYGTFEGFESVVSYYTEDGTTKSVSANVYNSYVYSVDIEAAGTGYETGTIIPITNAENDNGSGAIIQISSVSTGNVRNVVVTYGGAGYRRGDDTLIVGTGTGAGINVASVDVSETYHPNTYYFTRNYLYEEANTPMNTTTFTVWGGNANVAISNLGNIFVFDNTGPALTMEVYSPGTNYTEPPTISIVSNSVIKTAGILGRMSINDGGANYEIGDVLTFTNVPGGYGSGANAAVTNVASNGAITAVQFVPVDGQHTGGSGYNMSYLPTVSIASSNGSGANVTVTQLLGYGANVSGESGDIGSILGITIIARGDGYSIAPTLDLTNLGDGTANLVAHIIRGVYTYPGYYLNDDGFISSFNFLRGPHYRQNYSYVVRSYVPLKRYKNTLLDLNHPAGTKLFADLKIEYTANNRTIGPMTSNVSHTIFKNGTWENDNANVTLYQTNHGFSNGENAYLEFTSGDVSNVTNGFFGDILVVNNNVFSVIHYANTTNGISSSGNVTIGRTVND